MPVINKQIRVAKKSRICDDCQRWRIHPGDKYTRLFGNTHPGEKPYVLNICRSCKDPDAIEPDGYGYIRNYYSVPVEVGQAVECDGTKGTVLPADPGHAHYLRVKAEGEKHPGLWHPTWETVYYNQDGSIAADYRKQPQEATA